MAAEERNRHFVDKAYDATVNNCVHLDRETGECTFTGALNPGGRVRGVECLPYAKDATITFFDVTVNYKDRSTQRGSVIGNIWGPLYDSPQEIIKLHLCDCYEPRRRVQG
jgi:hypothetical protein